jgi:hypothetical protein
MHPGLRAARVARHLIFYVWTEEELFVLRVLHERADAELQVLKALRQRGG